MAQDIDRAAAETGPPVLSHGALGWLRANLFNSIPNAIITIVLAVVLSQVIFALINWLFLEAVWGERDPDTGILTADACRAASGACYAFIREKYRLILFGTFPFAEQWRPMVAVIVFISLLLLSCNRNAWRPWYRMAMAWVVGPTLILHLMYGGGLTLGQIAVPLLLIVGIASAVPDLRRFWPVLLVGWGLLGLFFVLPILLDIVGLVLGIVSDTLAGAMYALAELLRWPLAATVVPPWITFVPNTNWGGLPLTLGLSVIGLVVAFPLSLLLALGRRSDMPAVKTICVGFIEIIRGVPLITVLFMASVMFPLFLPTGITIDKLLRAQVAMIIFSAAYLAEVVRGGLQAIPTGQFEAADSLGLGYWQKMRLIILPQALKISIPPMVNTFIGFFKDTSLVIIIGLFDLLGTAKAALTDPAWRGFYKESYLFIALIYFSFCFFMSRYSQYLEKKLNTGHRPVETTPVKKKREPL